MPRARVEALAKFCWPDRRVNEPTARQADKPNLVAVAQMNCAPIREERDCRPRQQPQRGFVVQQST